MSLLREAGEALYGSQWQSETARALDINDRTLRRMLAEDRPLSPGIATDLQRLCLERAATLDTIAERLKAVAGPE